MTNNKTTYRRLGDYIREVDVRNTDLKQMNYKFKDIIEEIDEFNSELKYGLDDIVGVTIEKGLIPTVANLSQTKLDGFYIVKPDTFIYNPRTHGVRLGMGYNDTDNVYITSWNNVAFRVKSKDIVLPGYLWLYFNRPEWDRHTNFLAWGSSTIVFAWRDFLDINIDLPSIEEQRRIVTRYQAIQNRIENNKKTIAKLEEAAQALYRKMFVDGIDVERLPEGWRMGSVGELFELQRGFDLPSQNRIDGKYPICASTGISQFHNEYKVKAPGVVTGRSGSIGEVFYMTEDFWPLNTTLWVKDFKISSPYFVFYKLKELDLAKTIGGFAAVPTLNRNDVHFMESVIPSSDSMMEFQEKVNAIHSLCDNYKKEMEKLIEIQSLLMVGMGK